MITTAKQSSILQNFPKYRSMLAGNAAYIPNNFESIATINGDGSSTSFTFSGIPSTYSHLQIRCIVHNASNGAVVSQMRFNGDSGATNYSSKYFAARQTTVITGGSAGASRIDAEVYGSNGAGYPALSIIDIPNYANTTKYKTARIFTGYDTNTTNARSIQINWGTLKNTGAISSITLLTSYAASTSSKFALYGIKAT